jgi:hypothetical protein
MAEPLFLSGTRRCPSKGSPEISFLIDQDEVVSKIIESSNVISGCGGMPSGPDHRRISFESE